MKDFRKMWTELGMDLELHDQLIRDMSNLHKKTHLSQQNRPKNMERFDRSFHASHSGRVAEILDFKRVETDAGIIRKAGMSIPEIVKQNSWEYFRELESEVILEVCSMDQTVIDCGGGVVTRPENVEALKQSGVVFLLKADLKDILRRISSSSHRPALTSGRNFTVEVEQVLKEREPLYQAAADYIIDTSRESPRTAGKKIIEIYFKLTDSGNS